MMCKQTVCMGGSNSGVSVGHGKAVSYERRRRDVVAGDLPLKILKSQGRIVAFGGVCGTI